MIRRQREDDAMTAALFRTPARDPFLLPVCDCGGPMNLASLEPHPVDASQELKTYKCRHCGKQHVLLARRRTDRP
jgi:hypothetical protein